MRHLDVKMTRAFDGSPLAVIDGLPGGGAELRPQQLRQLALMLSQVADACERRKLTYRGRPLPDEKRIFLVNA